MTVRFALSVEQLAQLKSDGFVLCRGAAADLVAGLRSQTGSQLNHLLQAGVDWHAKMLAAAQDDPVMRATGAHARLKLSEHVSFPPLTSWHMEDSGMGVTDIRLAPERYADERDTSIGALIERVNELTSPLDPGEGFGLQVRLVPQERRPIPPRNELYEQLGFHPDGGGTFERTTDVKLLPIFKWLVGVYLTDMDAEYHERPCGQLVVIPGGHRIVCASYEKFLKAIEHEADPAVRWEKYREMITGPVRAVAKNEPHRLVTLRAKPGDILVAHGLMPHGPGLVWNVDPANDPPGRTAIYLRVGRFRPEQMGGIALTDPDLVWSKTST